MLNEGEFINGCGYPIVKIYNGHTLIETINFPIPDKDGLVEDPGAKLTKTEYLCGENDYDTEGFRMNWVISYKTQTIKPYSLAIGRLFLYQKNKFKIVLVPRNDVPNRGFIVNFINDSMPFGILKGGRKARGNKGMILKFEVKDLEQDLNWRDPNEIPSFTFITNESNTIF